MAARSGVAVAFDEDGLEDGEDSDARVGADLDALAGAYPDALAGADMNALAGADPDALADKLELGIGVDGLLIGCDDMMIVFCGPSTEDSACGPDVLVVGLKRKSVVVLKAAAGESFVSPHAQRVIFKA